MKLAAAQSILKLEGAVLLVVTRAEFTLVRNEQPPGKGGQGRDGIRHGSVAVARAAAPLPAPTHPTA
jgi:hypothetical protein